MQHDVRMLSRAELLRRGLAGALIGVAGTAANARAAGPPPAPQGDDLGFVQWGATAELVCVAFWNRALAGGGMNERTRRHVTAMRVADGQHLRALAAVLGGDAPTAEDFEIVLPKRALASRAGILAFGEELEESITRAYLAGVAQATDPATRLLLGKLLVQDVGHLDALRAFAGASSAFAGQRGPLELEQAGEWLDRFLRVRS
jgi:Ferritin-like domain